VRKAARGKFAVIAGQRRFLALSAPAERDQVPADLPVECRLMEADIDAAEIGLAENVVRQPMHPADQFEAFRNLIDKGSRHRTSIDSRLGRKWLNNLGESPPEIRAGLVCQVNYTLSGAASALAESKAYA
jgi:hypothetical protein